MTGNSSPVSTTVQSIPAGYNNVITALMNWKNSGLIPGSSIVSAYSQTIADPITGIPVYFPAQITTNGVKSDFNVNDKILGPNSSNVLKNVISPQNLQYVNTVAFSMLQDRVPVGNASSQQSVASSLTEEQKLQYSSNLDPQMRYKSPDQYVLSTTGAPIGIPGVLNAYLANNKSITYNKPSYNTQNYPANAWVINGSVNS